MYWLEVAVTTDGEAAEAISEALQPFAHNDSVILEQLGDPDSLDPYALEPEVTVKIYIDGDEDTPDLRRRIEEIVYYLGRLYPIPSPVFRKLEDADWANAWKAHYKPFRVGRRLWIQPSWLPAEETGSDDIVLTLDPGMAFGTGLHPTTQMCLQALEMLVQPKMRVLDVGTGSGILAVAAARLDAAELLAIDLDPLSVKAAQENAVLNGVAEMIEVREGVLVDVDPGAGWDLVVVNILAPVIINLLSQDGLLDYVAGNGRLILSGIIDEQAADVVAAAAEAGGEVLQKLTIRDWVCFVVGHQKKI